MTIFCSGCRCRSGVLRSHIFVVHMRCNGVQLSSCSLRFMQLGRNYGPECTVKVLNESEVCFFQVKFVKFLRISANSTKVCDICCMINDFIAVNQQFLNIILILSKIVNYALFPPGPSNRTCYYLCQLFCQVF